MTSIEQTGKNIEQATQLALAKLGVTEDQVDVEILDEGSKGFLGLGQSPAKVRVTVKNVESARDETSTTRSKPRQRSRPRSKQRPEAKKVQEPNERVEPSTAPAEQPVAEKAAREKPIRERPAREKPVREKPAPEVREPSPPITEEAANQAAEAARDTLQRILDGIGAGGSTGIKGVSDGQIGLEIQGGDAGILIGRHGQTIDAIQYLVNVIVHRQSGLRIRVSIDVGGYRTKREEALTKQALLWAAQVKEAGQEAVMDPLPASERRLVHAALADNPDVYTYSEGEEPNRHVVISPKK
jgi:spoIIIJ-associated protein